MPFQCHHCGECCTQPATQISITLGDIQRLCKVRGETVRQLFDKEIIGLFPFPDAFERHIYEINLGLTIPCKNREDNRCTVYKGRPISCRMFPYWILADAPKEEIPKLFDSDYECMNHFEFEDKDRPKYVEYKEALLNVLLKETKQTDALLEECNIDREINIKSTEEFKKNHGKVLLHVGERKKRDAHMIQYVTQILTHSTSSEKREMLITKITEVITKETFAPLERFGEIESILNKME